MVSQDTWNGLAFPTVKVRYSGAGNYRGARYVATIKHDYATYSASVPYDTEHDGKPSRIAAVWKALDRMADKRETERMNRDEYMIVWGDIDTDGYVGLLVPKYLLDR